MKEVYFKVGDKTCKAISKVRLCGESIALDFTVDSKMQILNFAVINNLDFYATDTMCTLGVPTDFIISIKNTDYDQESLTC